MKKLITSSISEINSNDVTFNSNSTNILEIKMNWKRYHRLESIYDYLLQMEALHPDLVKVSKIKVFQLYIRLTDLYDILGTQFNISI